MIKKSHAMIASLLLMVTIVLSGCTISIGGGNKNYPPESVKILDCKVDGADTYYRNKPAPVSWTVEAQNILETGDVSILVQIFWYNTATGQLEEFAELYSTTVNIVGGESYSHSGTWTYTRTAVATTYELKCSASHAAYDYSVWIDDFFVIWQSSGAPTGLQKGALQNMDNAGNAISRAQMYITAYEAAKAKGLILGTETVDLRGLKLGPMTADDAIALAQSRLDTANGELGVAFCAFYGVPSAGCPSNYNGQDYSSAFALSKLSKDDALMAKKIVALVLGQLSLGKGVVLNLV